MKKCKCVNCGIESENNIGSSFVDYLNNGFKPVWNTSDGLTTIVLCEKCYNIVKDHVTEIENIIKREIDEFQFIKYKD